MWRQLILNPFPQSELAQLSFTNLSCRIVSKISQVHCDFVLYVIVLMFQCFNVSCIIQHWAAIRNKPFLIFSVNLATLAAGVMFLSCLSVCVPITSACSRVVRTAPVGFLARCRKTRVNYGFVVLCLSHLEWVVFFFVSFQVNVLFCFIVFGWQYQCSWLIFCPKWPVIVLSGM